MNEYKDELKAIENFLQGYLDGFCDERAETIEEAWYKDDFNEYTWNLSKVTSIDEEDEIIKYIVTWKHKKRASTGNCWKTSSKSFTDIRVTREFYYSKTPKIHQF